MILTDVKRPQWTERFALSTRIGLERHLGLLRKWNSAINLVASASLADAWTRHVLDSAQIFDLGRENCRHWVDLGSGAGFPGMVVAVLAQELAPELRVTLVESDRRKAEFLRTVSRETAVPVTVMDSRIEDLPPLRANVVSARALASLSVLCSYAARHLAPDGRAIFLKGSKAEEEVRLAGHDWAFDLISQRSQTDPAASILLMSNLRHA